jgi:2-polyprenyl-6-methoxyphenol hydroxylase-like FAD-dependent oxidoreductase
VVGETVVGLTLTLLLRRAGYDPLLVSGIGRPAISRVSYLCAPALRILDSIGVGSRLRKRGTRIDSVSVRRSPQAEAGSTVLPRNERSMDTRPVVVRTSDLRSALESQLPDRQRRVDRTVGTLARRNDGLAVEFVDGIREWFDVAVDAGGGGASLRHGESDPPEYAVLTQYETGVEADATSRNRLLDVWHSDKIVQRVPRPNDRGFVLRVTAPRPALATVANSENGEESLGTQRLPDEVQERALEGIETRSTTVRQVRLSDESTRREWWGSGRVSFCGSAACPLAPASGFVVSFGIEDAVTFVSELGWGARPVAEAVAAYAADRKRRLTRLRRTTEAEQFDPEYPTLRSAESSLASLRALRQVALGSFLGEPMPTVQREGFR